MKTSAPLEIQFSLRTKLRAPRENGEQVLRSAGRLPRITQVLALAIHLEEHDQDWVKPRITRTLAG